MPFCLALCSALLRFLQSPEGLGVNNKRQTTETLPRCIDLCTSMLLVASGTESAPANELDMHWPRKPVCVSATVTKIV